MTGPLLIQLAAAYARLDDRAAADAHLRQALAELKPRPVAPQPAPAPEAEASEPQA